VLEYDVYFFYNFIIRIYLKFEFKNIVPILTFFSANKREIIVVYIAINLIQSTLFSFKISQNFYFPPKKLKKINILSIKKIE